MRLLLVDSDSELVRCDFPVRLFDTKQLTVQYSCKVAATVLDQGRFELERYQFDSYRPYQDVDGYFVFLADSEDAPVSPTTLNEVMSACEYVGYLRRPGSEEGKNQSVPPSIGDKQTERRIY